jgi:hypothetical protein
MVAPHIRARRSGGVARAWQEDEMRRDVYRAGDRHRDAVELLDDAGGPP